VHLRVFGALIGCLLSLPVSADPPATPSLTQPQTEYAPPAGAMPEILRDIGLDQKLNDRVPLNLPFRDETGRTIHLGDLLKGRPLILVLAYYECPMLCTQVLNGLTSTLGVLSFSIGREFDVVTVSFDPRDTAALAASKKAAYLERYRSISLSQARPDAEANWRFLTGDQLAITALTRAVGFRYAYNKEVDQFAHASGFLVLTPDGRISRYFYGIEYGPRDVRLALVEAADRKIGSAVDELMLYCFHYDPASGRYSFAVMSVVRLAGIATVLAMAGFILALRHRDGRRTATRRAHA
jgi:protein SCO1